MDESEKRDELNALEREITSAELSVQSLREHRDAEDIAFATEVMASGHCSLSRVVLSEKNERSKLAEHSPGTSSTTYASGGSRFSGAGEKFSREREFAP